MNIKNLIAASLIALSPTVAVSQQWQSSPETIVLQVACAASLSEIEIEFPDLYAEIQYQINRYGFNGAARGIRDAILLSAEQEMTHFPPESILEQRVTESMVQWLSTDGLKILMSYNSFEDYRRNLSTARSRLLNGCVAALAAAFSNPT